MKWITREKARVDRIACPWLITRFIDPHPEFLFVPERDVMGVAATTGAVPFDVANVDLGHRGPQCSFDAFIDRYELTDPVLAPLALIVRGADTDDRELTPESPGLYAAASGFRAIARDDHDNMARQFPLYDALYANCRERVGEVPRSRQVLFVCLHGAAKSVMAASLFNKIAIERGVALRARAAGTEPDAEVSPAAAKGLLAEGIDVTTRRPRLVTFHDVAGARRVVQFGCDVTPWLRAGERVTAWADVPNVSDGYAGARAVIAPRIEALVDELSAAS